MSEEQLRAELAAANSRIRELEDALAVCVAKGLRLRSALHYYSDVPGSSSHVAAQALERDP